MFIEWEGVRCCLRWIAIVAGLSLALLCLLFLMIGNRNVTAV